MEEIIEYIEKEDENVDINLNEKSLSCGKKRNVAIVFLQKATKRTFDIIAGLFGTIALIPLMIVVFIGNKISNDNGPLFYFQERIGQNGKIYKMLKFRSMVVNAEEELKSYLKQNKEANEEYKKYKKLKNDPRITKMGKFLRKTSLDEMPQVLHLITGKMSVVGPRPYLLYEKEDMGKYYDLIIKNRPGITGLWQVSGRSNATFDERLDLDIRYTKNKSIKLDVTILYKTVKCIIKKEGAL